MESDQSISVLYVDGDSARADTVASVLAKSGVTTTAATTIAAAEAELHHTSYDLILMCDTVPDGSGIGFIQRTSKSGRTPAYVMVATSPDLSIAVAAMRAGALDVVSTVPHDEFVRTLPVAVANAVNRAALRRQGHDLHTGIVQTDRRFSRALQSSPVPTMLVDTHDTLLMVNQAWRDAIGLSSLIGRSLDDLLALTFTNPPEIKTSLAITADSPNGEATLVVGVRSQTEQEKTWRCHLARLDDPTEGGDEPLVVCHGLDITDTMLLEARLRNLSLEDALTGLPNRRSLEDRLPQEVARARRDQTDLAVAMIDIDFFKPYNDRYGHVEGDRCLREVAQAMRAALRRPGDYAARYGGEEFVSILPGVDAEGAREVLASMRRAVERLAIEHDASDAAPVVTISIGYTTLAASASDDPTALVVAADEALFAAKSAGRNRVVGPSGEPESA